MDLSWIVHLMPGSSATSEFPKNSVLMLAWHISTANQTSCMTALHYWLKILTALACPFVLLTKNLFLSGKSTYATL
uniref:Uncharacterized protein n=1 Tax=Arundo donax TaxID=35708 RepID=A0A0A8ZZQ6_ARUDO